MKGKQGIILAADMTVEKHCLAVIRAVGPWISGIKIGHPLILARGLSVVQRLKTVTDLPVIADIKIIDICNVARKTIDLVGEVGCDAITVWGHSGQSTIRDCVRRAAPMKVFVMTQLSTPDGLMDDDAADSVAAIAKEEGAYGVQAPATMPYRVARTREIVGDDLVVFACGIGVQGAKPGTAIRAGADYEVIGRSIYATAYPEVAAQTALEAIRSAKKLETRTALQVG